MPGKEFLKIFIIHKKYSALKIKTCSSLRSRERADLNFRMLLQKLTHLHINIIDRKFIMMILQMILLLKKVKDLLVMKKISRSQKALNFQTYCSIIDRHIMMTPLNVQVIQILVITSVIAHEILTLMKMMKTILIKQTDAIKNNSEYKSLMTAMTHLKILSQKRLIKKQTWWRTLETQIRTRNRFRKILSNLIWVSIIDLNLQKRRNLCSMNQVLSAVTLKKAP